MKRKNIIAFSVALMAIGAFTSCSDEFLQDKKNYDYVDASTYNTFSGAKARVDDIYAWCLPNTSLNQVGNTIVPEQPIYSLSLQKSIVDSDHS